MQMAIKSIIILLVIYLSLIFFLPKKELYFFGESQLTKYKAIIGEEQIRDRFFDLELKNGKLFIDEIDMASFEKINIYPTFFINKVKLQNFSPTKSLQKIMPVEIRNLVLFHTIFNPLKIDIKIGGNFGDGEGVVDLDKKFVKIYLKPKKESKSFSKIKKFLKKTKEGWIYEKKF